MRSIALFVALSAGSGLGCSLSVGGLTPPDAALSPSPRSALAGEVDEVIAAFAGPAPNELADRMTSRLLSELGPAALSTAANDLRERFGEPRGIMEEQQSQEGELTWFSSLVVFAREDRGREILTPVLFQFALTPTRQIERLLVREHVFIENLRGPTERYQPVTRFVVPTTGDWTVSQGGPTRELNAHHGSESQRYAYDLVLVIDGRFRDGTKPKTSNEAYFGYGEPLLAPAAGTVVKVVDGVPDNVPKKMGEAGGNGVVIDHGFGEVSSLWHAKPGSVLVKEGDRVQPGQPIAQVGNSGRSSGAHIHVHLTRGQGEIALPMPFVDLWVDGVAQDRALPIKGQRVESRLVGPPPPTADPKRPPGPEQVTAPPRTAARPHVVVDA